jgi:hypothetical protein
MHIAIPASIGEGKMKRAYIVLCVLGVWSLICGASSYGSGDSANPLGVGSLPGHHDLASSPRDRFLAPSSGQDNPAPLPADPDIALKEIKLVPASPVPYEPPLVKVVVANAGTGEIPDAPLSFLWQYGQAGASQPLVRQGCSTNLARMSPGEVRELDAENIKFWPQEPGAYSLRIELHLGGDLYSLEKKLENNTLTLDFTVAPGAKPDIVMTRIGFNPSTPAPNAPFWIEAEAKNAGPGTVTNIPARTRIYNQAGVMVLERTQGSSSIFRTGATTSVRTLVDPGLAPGQYQIEVTADFENSLDETDETNNALIKGLQIAAPGAPADTGTAAPQGQATNPAAGAATSTDTKTGTNTTTDTTSNKGTKGTVAAKPGLTLRGKDFKQPAAQRKPLSLAGPVFEIPENCPVGIRFDGPSTPAVTVNLAALAKKLGNPILPYKAVIDYNGSPVLELGTFGGGRNLPESVRTTVLREDQVLRRARNLSAVLRIVDSRKKEVYRQTVALTAGG